MISYKIIIVDDHELIINGITNLLTPYPRFQIISHVDNGLAVYHSCRVSEPDILILDLGLPNINGLDLIPQLCQRWPKLRILAYTAHEEEHMAIHAFRAGAIGYVLKTSSQQILLAALQTIILNKRYIDPSLNQDAVLSALNDNSNENMLLTPRERQILKLIAEGDTNRIIAKRFNISIKTVETHRLNMMRKLGVHKVTELLKCSRRLGLTD